MAEQETVKTSADLVGLLDGAVATHFKAFKEENAQQLQKIAEATSAKVWKQAADLANSELAKLQKLRETAEAAIEEVKQLKKELRDKKAKISEQLDVVEQEGIQEFETAAEEQLAVLKSATNDKLAELAGVKELATDGVVEALKGELVAESPDLSKCRLLVDALSEKSANKEGSKQLIFRLHRQLNVLEFKQLKGEPSDFKDALPALLNFNTFLKTGILSPEQTQPKKTAKVDKSAMPEVLTKEQQKQQVKRRNEIFRLEQRIKEAKERIANHKEGTVPEAWQEWLGQDEFALAELKGDEQSQQKIARQETDEDSFTLESEGGVK